MIMIDLVCGPGSADRAGPFLESSQFVNFVGID